MAELTEQDLDEIFPVIALMEGRCAFDAVCKAKPHDLKRLDDIHARLEKYAEAGDIERYYEQNYTFHEAVQKLAGNLWAAKDRGRPAQVPQAPQGPAAPPARPPGGLPQRTPAPHGGLPPPKPGGRLENHVRPSAGPAGGSPGCATCGPSSRATAMRIASTSSWWGRIWDIRAWFCLRLSRGHLKPRDEG